MQPSTVPPGSGPPAFGPPDFGPPDRGPWDRGPDPCLQIQVDLSAMVDGELDPAGVRRVMVHSAVSGPRPSFLEGIRSQVRIHKKLAAALATDATNGARVGGVDGLTPALARLREQLTANRRKL